MYRLRRSMVIWSRRLAYAGLGCAAVGLGTSGSKTPTTLDRIQQEGTLRIATRTAPTTFFVDQNGPHGFEYELAQRFAEDLGVRLDVVAYDNPGVLLDGLTRQKAHIGAAGLTPSTLNDPHVEFGPAYLETTQRLVYRRGKTRPKEISDLIGSNLLVRERSSHAARLAELRKDFPELEWTETAQHEVFDLLGKVQQGEIDYTVVNAHEYAVNRAYFPQVIPALQLTPKQPVAWAVPKSEDQSLLLAIQDFFERIEENGELEQIQDHFFSHSQQLSYVGARAFIRHTRSRLPRYEQTIRDAANRHGFDWRMLAATAYQESHWNPRAVSPTGVRGFMMLTQATAGEVGVKNRINAEQSIKGGALYLSRIKRRLHKGITEPDRTWFALAAYNVGLGHLNDARKITKNQGDDPNRWEDVRRYLPLLREKQWYKQTRYGFARGDEPVKYVQNIQRYQRILAWMTRQKSPKPPSLAPDASGQLVKVANDPTATM